jgi:hypothetical protein
MKGSELIHSSTLDAVLQVWKEKTRMRVADAGLIGGKRNARNTRPTANVPTTPLVAALRSEAANNAVWHAAEARAALRTEDTAFPQQP